MLYDHIDANHPKVFLLPFEEELCIQPVYANSLRTLSGATVCLLYGFSFLFFTGGGGSESVFNDALR